MTAAGAAGAERAGEALAGALAPGALAGGAAREGRASGKVVLFGEHAVVHGVPALAAPVGGRGTLVVARARAAAGLEVTCARGLDTDLARAMTERALALAAESGERAPAAPGLAIAIRSDLPHGGGLGSSAALAVALVRALASAPLAPAEVARRAHDLERLAHGTPSGMDTAAIALGRPVAFRRGAAPAPLALADPLRLVVAVLPRAGTTASLVGHVRALAERGDPRFTRFIERTAAVVEEARALLSAPRGERDAAALGRLAREAHAALAAIGVSSPAQDALCAALERAGALGAKLSGAGGGGATLAFVDPLRGAAGERALCEVARAKGALDAFVAEVPPRADEGGEPGGGGAASAAAREPGERTA